MTDPTREFEIAEREHCAAARILADLVLAETARLDSALLERLRAAIGDYAIAKRGRERAERAFIEAQRRSG